MTISTGYQVLAGVLVALCSYFVGNISSAIVISRLKGKDIRECGSGNPGTMNMLRTYGKILGVLTLVFDVAKTVAVCMLGWCFMGNKQFLALGSDRIGLYVSGISATLGHIYPVTRRFKGGKGAATIIGVCLTMHPVVTLAAFAVGVAFLFATTIGSITSFIILVPSLFYEGLIAANNPLAVYCEIMIFAMLVLCLWAHRKNIIKLFIGTEGRVVIIKPKHRKPAPDRAIIFDDVTVVE